MCARLALSIFSLSSKETGEVIGSVIEKWYRDASQWKAAFEAAIQIIVCTIIPMPLKHRCISTGERERLGAGRRNPTGLNGSVTPRNLLSGRGAVSSGVE
jgi:hypothetical protein